MKRILPILFTIFIALCSSGNSFAATNERSESMVTIDGVSYYVHTVSKGETIYSLSKVYDVNEDDIIEYNPQVAEGLKTDQVLKIPVKVKTMSRKEEKECNKLFDRHTVNQGETAYSLSKFYGITLNTLLADNPGLDPSSMPIGMVLNIRKSGENEEAPKDVDRDFEKYRDAANMFSDKYNFHLVEQGETLYSLSKKYNIGIDEIKRANSIEGVIKIGELLKIPRV